MRVLSFQTGIEMETCLPKIYGSEVHYT